MRTKISIRLSCLGIFAFLCATTTPAFSSILLFESIPQDLVTHAHVEKVNPTKAQASSLEVAKEKDESRSDDPREQSNRITDSVFSTTFDSSVRPTDNVSFGMLVENEFRFQIDSSLASVPTQLEPQSQFYEVPNRPD